MENSRDSRLMGSDEPASASSLHELRPGNFVVKTADAVARLMAHRQNFNVQVRGRLAKFWFGPDASVHYELWLHERTAQLEIGLHFESDPATNERLYHAFDRCLLEIQDRLGPSVALEVWDRGWTRLYETEPLWPLDAVRVEAVAERICRFIAVVQPLYESIER